MKAFKSMILTAFLVLLGILSGCSPDEKRPVVFADPGWDSVRFHNAVAQLVAEKVYGLKTEILYGSTPITQAALVRGDADVNMELWTDNVPTYEADKAAGGIVDLGVNYDDNRQGFYVPRYVIEGDAERGIAPMAPDLKSVKDLSNLSVGVFTPSRVSESLDEILKNSPVKFEVIKENSNISTLLRAEKISKVLFWIYGHTC